MSWTSQEEAVTEFTVTVRVSYHETTKQPTTRSTERAVVSTRKGEIADVSFTDKDLNTVLRRADAVMFDLHQGDGAARAITPPPGHVIVPQELLDRLMHHYENSQQVVGPATFMEAPASNVRDIAEEIRAAQDRRMNTPVTLNERGEALREQLQEDAAVDAEDEYEDLVDEDD